jgi:hypothetical protein
MFSGRYNWQQQCLAVGQDFIDGLSSVIELEA